MKLSVNKMLRVIALSSLVLLIALAATSFALAQGDGVKPIGLVSGPVIPDMVPPANVVVSPDTVFDGKYFKLVQFAAIPGDAERKGWEEAGMWLVDYLPDDTYFAVIKVSFDLNQLTDQALTIVDVPDAARLEPRLVALIAAGQPVDRLVVSYYATLDAGKVIADLEAKGVTIEAHRDYSRQLDILIDPASLDEIIARPYLQFLGPEPEEPVLEGYDHRNATGRSNYLNTGYNGLNYNGAGVVVAIGEDGTVDGLVDVKGRLIEMVAGDPASHKIGVMQNAGGAGNLDPSNRNNAWGAAFVSVEGFPDYAALYTSDAVRYTNHSYGVSIAGGYDSSARDHDMRIATLPNHLVIYSAGNSGDELGYAPYNFAGCPADPAQCWANITGKMKQNKNMFAVGALSPADVLTYFSSRGPMYDGRIIPQVVTEGIEGTSDAAPKISGDLAILAQVYKVKNGGAEPPSSLLRAILMNTADDLGNPGPDFKHGYGQVNLRRAYGVIDGVRYMTDSVANGDTDSFTLAVPAGAQQVRVMIVWPDVAASVNADPAIVNDLNLLATDPTLTTSYDPWVLDHSASVAAISAPATRQIDSRNTIEQVTVDSPTAGNWTIEVNGANVPTGPQTYYLTYEFLMDELHMGFPLKDHRFVPGTAYHLKWDSYGNVGTFNLDYQLDGGSWVNIATGYAAASRTYQWTAPAVTGIHTIKFRVQRGALTSESDVNYIGDVPDSLDLHWACDDSVRLTWDAVAGATSYKVYRLGAQYMEEVTSNITFDGTSAILIGQSTISDEYYAVSAVTGANEGLRTMALTKTAGDFNCFNVATTIANSVDEIDITLKGWVNPHGSTLTNVHFEYGPTASYGSTSSNITTSASGHTEEAVSSVIASTMSDRADVLHFRLAATKNGSPVHGDDQEIRLTPGYALAFDGVDDYLDLSGHPALPIYRSGAGTGYSVSFWIKANAAASSGKIIYGEGSSTSSSPRLVFQTSGSYPNGMWILMYRDDGTNLVNSSRNMQLLDNTWHHFTWVDINGSAKIYLDGNQSGSTISYTPGSMTLDTASLGARLATSVSGYFPGVFDEITFWDKALSATEIRALMHQPPQENEANLRAFYRLDDGPASRVVDAVSVEEASIVGGGSKSFSTAPVGVTGTLVQTTTPTSVGEMGKRMTVSLSAASSVNYLGIYKTGHGGKAVTGETFPAGVTRRASILWGIKEFGAATADLVFNYSAVPNITNPAAIQLLKRADAASAWTDVTADFIRDDTARTFTKTGVTDFSEFSIGDGGQNPLAVTLAAFDAQALSDHILVTWETASEIGNSGFNLYRSLSPDGELSLLAHLPSPAPGSAQGATYSHQDSDVIVGQTYWYWLESVSLNGGIILYEPVSVVYQIPTAVTLVDAYTQSASSSVNPWWIAAFSVLLLAGAGYWLRQRRAL